ncbi:tol-pal system protein YbgF [Aromatoleum toluvorans]|uniref:Cell division coordinator CpoB n=1 Tax=Aromatoleum toluvorans TaxID=92002 RepID=A0ABX1Q1P3_9RHOO|nr:tol-pal system protein YbgF [Aromatoleum toluvorans]NMG44820.1 tol-pal system protein YbgF [Aromatoleum toluvorans]
MKRLLPLAVLASLSYIAPSHALFDDDEARRAIINLRTELTPRVERLEESSRGQLELSNQNELLRTEVSKLHGQLEVLLHEIESLKQRQRDFYVDLDSRVRKLEATSAAAAPEAQAPAADPAAESRDYEAALNLLKDGKYKDAQAAFDQFIKRYPRSTVLPGAHFWAGNAALQAKEVAVANNYFKTVLANWPNDPVAPDAMLGIANSQQALGDAKSSQDTLKKLVERFPESSAGKAAKQRLARKP